MQYLVYIPSILLIVICITLLFYHSTYAMDSGVSPKNSLTAAKPASMSGLSRYISVTTDKVHYGVGEAIQIFGKVFNVNGTPSTANIILSVNSIPSNNSSKSIIVYNTSSLAINGSFSVMGLIAQDPGTYRVSTSLAKSFNQNAWTQFVIENPFASISDQMFGIAALNLLALLVILTIKRLGLGDKEILSFIFISGMILSTVAGLLFADVELGPTSPVGLILKHQVDEKGQIKLNNLGQPAGSEWMINVGGYPNDNYAEGIQIPIYVIAFGILGGYLRYLYDISLKNRETIQNRMDTIDKEVELERTDPKQKSLLKQMLMRRFYIFNILERLSLIFLAPILAIAVWLLLSQLGIQGVNQSGPTQTGIFVMAAVSFTVGLITNEAVSSLITFATARLSTAAANQQPGSSTAAANQQPGSSTAAANQQEEKDNKKKQ